MYPHRIRLDAAWTRDAGRVHLPTAGHGPARLRRSFGLPRQIDAYERVWLTAVSGGDVRWTFNGEPLTINADVTPKLRPRNELVAECAGEWSLSSVGLMIRCSAYLHGVHRRDGQVVGEVAGECDGPLELYLLAGDVHAGYRTIRAGEAFAFPLAGPGRVELVNVSAVWDAYELAENITAPPC